MKSSPHLMLTHAPSLEPLAGRGVPAEPIGSSINAQRLTGTWLRAGMRSQAGRPAKPQGFMVDRLVCAAIFLAIAFAQSALFAAETTTPVEVKQLTVNGALDEEQARLVIQANLKHPSEAAGKSIVAASIEHTIQASRDALHHTGQITCDIIQGEPKEIVLLLDGQGEILEIKGEWVQDWSIRQESGGPRYLIVRPKKTDKPASHFIAAVKAETKIRSGEPSIRPLVFTSPQPALISGFIRIDAPPELRVQADNPSGLVPIETQYLPASMRSGVQSKDPEPLAFRFHGSPYALALKLSEADPEARQVTLSDFNLTGNIEKDQSTFALTALARVRNPKGGALALLSGGAALISFEPAPGGRMMFEQGAYTMRFDKDGEFPLKLIFNAAVKAVEGWNRLEFQMAPCPLQPVTFRGLAPETQWRFAGAARPEWANGAFHSFLPANGNIKLSWKESRAEAEGKLFYAAEMHSQISVAPGLMRQWAWIDGRVMQGELDQLELTLKGAGEVTRVLGDQVLSWALGETKAGGERTLAVRFNQPQKERFIFQVQCQTPLDAFPQAFEAMRIQPRDSTRFAGYYRVLSEGAVRLEVMQASGLSQISPEQVPDSGAASILPTNSIPPRFAFRFSGAGHQLRIQADNIWPEISVSQITVYHLGETESVIDAELELDIREAPLRELSLRMPQGYGIARLIASGMSDYFLQPEEAATALLRLVYTKPLSGRHLIQLRLERNQSSSDTQWVLPRIELPRAKSVRGYAGITADPGYRLTPASTDGLTEIATAFFPKKIAGIQTAFRLSDPLWRAAIRIERLPQSIQADVVHLFSIGEGIAYGSSVINYLVSGAPRASFHVQLSNEYANVEFTGKDIRSWRQTTNGYEIQLHAPVAGGYSLLATYERAFKAQGETLAFSGARPIDAQSEQGYALVVSTFPFQVKPAAVSAGLTPLEPGEVPPECRLFFDAPLLAAYRYASRPYQLQLALSPLAQGQTLSQVIDRASMTTRISKEGQVLTDARYFIKNRGQTHCRLVLPADTQLWSATVNGAPCVPIADGATNLVPLPQKGDLSSVHILDFKLATRSRDPQRLTVTAPTLQAPVLLAEWNFEPESGRRLVYQSGSLTPIHPPPDNSGFAGLRFLVSRQALSIRFGSVVVLTLLAVLLWRWTGRSNTCKHSLRYWSGLGIGLVALVVAGVNLVGVIADLSRLQTATAPRGLSFLAPIQQATSTLQIQVLNVIDPPSGWTTFFWAWPAMAAVAVWCYTWVTSKTWFKPVGINLGWLLLAWTALRWPKGAGAFLGLATVFLIIYVIWPSLVRLRKLPLKRGAEPPEGNVPVAATLLALAAFLTPEAQAQTSSNTANPAPVPAFAESVVQEVRVQDQYVTATARIRWIATNGQTLVLLRAPGVMTSLVYPTNVLRLYQSPETPERRLAILAQQSGSFDLVLHYQLQTEIRNGASGFVLPTQQGLVNQIDLRIAGLDVEANSDQAVSVKQQSEPNSKDTIARLILSPAPNAWIGWKPRSRDTKHERAVFYAELYQLYTPSAGVIEGTHQAQIRPAQGELAELEFIIPPGLTVTDVIDPGATRAVARTEAPPAKSMVSLWRFNPDSRSLRVALNPPQSKPFALRILSQCPTGSLPFEKEVGLISLTNAAGQIGLLGVATGNEVQLEGVQANGLSPISLEDFPGSLVQSLSSQAGSLTLRRAFRYGTPNQSFVLKASAVEPDVRIEYQETLSLGEDRIVLAVNAKTEISRAGIFRLSFVLPAGLDIESITGAALSHWTELRTNAGRVITLHLKGKTEGQQAFDISLSGPGQRAVKGWAVPQFSLREASKQRGQLIIVPEQGMRLQVATREGVTQLDPQKAGIRQKGVLAFRLLQDTWRLVLDTELVDPWIQVTSLQQVRISEAQVKVTANLQYQIDNAGLKSFRIRLPARAESVRFQGDQVSDFIARPEAAGQEIREYEIKLHRRMMGTYLLQATYQLAVPESARQISIQGIQAIGVNLQRGFVTIQADGRLQTQVSALPAALQPAEWQSIPRALLQDLPSQSANHTYRLTDPAFDLAVGVERREAAKLLPARVNRVQLTSVISDDGVMLTQVRLDMVPGDKRLLHLTLPQAAYFWFAFVNQNGVWPWMEQDQILIPLEQQAKTGQDLAVEFFYSSRIGTGTKRRLDLAMAGPKFDLPLENIQWRVYLNDKWCLKKWTGDLQLTGDQIQRQPAAIDTNAYLENEASLQRQKTQQAESMIQVANNFLQQGDPQQARRNFQAAYGLSQHDYAFNEDARVQLHNLKMQQALVGLNLRQAAITGDQASLAAKSRLTPGDKPLAYTQDEAKQLIERNTAEESGALMKLAERLIQQQDAAQANPSAIRATIPEQGRLLTFQRPVQVNTWVDLRIKLQAVPASTTATGMKILILLGIVVATAWLTHKPSVRE